MSASVETNFRICIKRNPENLGKIICYIIVLLLSVVYFWESLRLQRTQTLKSLLTNIRPVLKYLFYIGIIKIAIN